MTALLLLIASCSSAASPPVAFLDPVADATEVAVRYELGSDRPIFDSTVAFAPEEGYHRSSRLMDRRGANGPGDLFSDVSWECVYEGYRLAVTEVPSNPGGVAAHGTSKPSADAAVRQLAMTPAGLLYGTIMLHGEVLSLREAEWTSVEEGTYFADAGDYLMELKTDAGDGEPVLKSLTMHWRHDKMPDRVGPPREKVYEALSRKAVEGTGVPDRYRTTTKHFTHPVKRETGLVNGRPLETVSGGVRPDFVQTVHVREVRPLAKGAIALRWDDLVEKVPDKTPVGAVDANETPHWFRDGRIVPVSQKGVAP